VPAQIKDIELKDFYTERTNVMVFFSEERIAMRYVKPPPYTNVKKLADGTPAYYFNPPSWARLKGCTVTHEPLGTDKKAAYDRVSNVLFPHFNSWLTGGASDLIRHNPAVGTIEWLFMSHYVQHRDFTDLADSTQVGHKRRLRRFCDFLMTDGSRLGTWPLKEFEPEIVDRIYDVMLARKDPIITLGKNGKKKKKQPGKTDVNHTMKVCRTAWNVGHRSKSTLVPEKNPFVTRLRWHHETTYKATWDQLVQFVCMADKLGHGDVGTAALAVWEFCQRPTHVFAHLLLDHWRPDEFCNHVYILHPKTDEEMWLPLFDTAKKGRKARLLYPDLAPRLEVLCENARKAGRSEGLMFVKGNARSFKKTGWAGKGDSISAVNKVVREIVEAAGLPKQVTMAAFRHGGITELGDADLTDTQIRNITRQSARQLPTYIGPTQVQARTAQRKRIDRRIEKKEEPNTRILIEPLRAREVRRAGSNFADADFSVGFVRGPGQGTRRHATR
jgi:hypothetical protein